MKHSQSKRILIATLILFSLSNFIVFSAQASSLVISEIMYNLPKPGEDTGREWIEIFNSGSETVDISNWKLYEDKTNHGINLVKETDNFIIPAGSYAVFVDNATKFLTDWPNYTGKIFDSSFSLSNTSESITLRNAELVDIDSVSYSSGWGGNGDGNSLAKIVLSEANNSSNWQGNSPTPGQENTFSSPDPSPSINPSPSPSPSTSPSPSPSLSPSPSHSVSATPSISPSPTASPPAGGSPTPSPHPSFSPSPTLSISPLASPSPSYTASVSPTPRASFSSSFNYPSYNYSPFQNFVTQTATSSFLKTGVGFHLGNLPVNFSAPSSTVSSTTLSKILPQSKILDKIKGIFSSSGLSQKLSSLPPKAMLWGLVVAGVSAAAVLFLFLKI